MKEQMILAQKPDCSLAAALWAVISLINFQPVAGSARAEVGERRRSDKVTDD